MIKEYCFTCGNADLGDFMYVYSPIVKTYPTFVCEDNCLSNRFDKTIGDYEYISLVTKEKYNRAKLSVVCDFHKYGAPIIVFANDIYSAEGKDGATHLFYSVHFEIVAWENGCNIWHIVPFPDRAEHPVKPTKLLANSFAIKENTPVTITAEVEKGRLKGDVNGIPFYIEHPDIPAEFHIGYTACEGINRLYQMTLEA